jgi:hypothetical protein
MWQTILSAVAGAVPAKLIDAVLKGIVTSQFRKNLRRAIRDVIEDEMHEALTDHGVSEEAATEYVNRRKGRLKKEIRARFDATLQR